MLIEENTPLLVTEFCNRKETPSRSVDESQEYGENDDGMTGSNPIIKNSFNSDLWHFL